MRELLRSLPVFAVTVPDFDVDGLPDAPSDLFARWIDEAVGAGVPEPHAMTLSTVDAAGIPDARVLILKDLENDRWWFATSSTSAKGSQLAVSPRAALTFYWPLVARQVRVRGSVAAGPPDLSAADFLSRSIGARAVALSSDESQPLADRSDCARAVTRASEELAANPDLVAPGWQVYALTAHTIEFWQADPERMHTRVQYNKDRGRWTRQLLWP